MKPLRVFIGFDPRQPVAYTVAAHSVAMSSSVPVAITPLIHRQLPIKRTGLTEFTFTRYLVPWLCNYEGHALFIDADMLAVGDIAELPWDSEHAVSVVPHQESELVPGFKLYFERCSVMLFNCAKCRVLTPEYIESGSPQSLEWAGGVGDLPPEWNHLVGYDKPKPAKLVHYTQGIPCFQETQNDEYAEPWITAARHAMGTVSWEGIMGRSVHARFKRTQKPEPRPLLAVGED